MNTRSGLLCIVAVVSLLLGGTGRAADDLARRAPLGDLIAHGLAHNPGLQAAAVGEEAARAGIPAAGGWPDPRFTVGHFVESVETRVGPQRWRLGLSQAIPWSGRLNLSREAATLSANIARLEYQDLRRHLEFDIRATYAEYRRAQQAVLITAQHAALMEQLVGVVGARHVTGAPQDELLRIQMESAALRDAHARAEDQVLAVRAHLNALLGRPAGASLADAEPPSDTAEPRAVGDEGIAAHPRLLIPHREAARQELARRLADRRFFPDLIVGLQWIQTDEAPLPGVTDNGKDPIIATVGVQVPLWFRKHRAAQQQAALLQSAAELRADETAHRLAAELWQAHSEWRASARRVDLYRDELIPTAEQTYAVTLEAYTSGAASFTDLIGAQRLILDQQLALERALADRARQSAHIDYLTAEED